MSDCEAERLRKQGTFKDICIWAGAGSACVALVVLLVYLVLVLAGSR